MDKETPKLSRGPSWAICFGTGHLNRPRTVNLARVPGLANQGKYPMCRWILCLRLFLEPFPSARLAGSLRARESWKVGGQAELKSRWLGLRAGELPRSSCVQRSSYASTKQPARAYGSFNARSGEGSDQH